MSAACTSKVEPPQDLVSPAKMSEILVDIHLLEKKISQSRVPYDSQQLMYAHFEQLVFEKHQLDSATYINSLKYYLADPALMETIYTSVVDSLTVREKTKRID